MANSFCESRRGIKAFKCTHQNYDILVFGKTGGIIDEIKKSYDCYVNIHISVKCCIMGQGYGRKVSWIVDIDWIGVQSICILLSAFLC